MQAVSLAPGVDSSSVGFGCAGLMREPSRRRRQAVLASALEHGITHFDVARMYGLGAAEGELGRFLAGRRREVVIATKFGIEPTPSAGRLAALQGPARGLLARSPALRARVKRRASALDRRHSYDVATAQKSLETSLRELRTDYIDILLLHGPCASDPIDAEELGEFLEDRRRTGQIRAWGLAGERRDCLTLAQSLPGASIVQIREDVFSRGAPALAPAEEPRANIVFGVLSSALARITSAGDQRLARADALARPDALAPLLLADALHANPAGVVLFSTTRPQRLETVDRALALSSGDHAELNVFRDGLGAHPAQFATAGVPCE
jgi:D-threo-aldose 1-dehydrogenase